MVTQCGVQKLHRLSQNGTHFTFNSSLLCTPGHARSLEECNNRECRALKWWTRGVAGRIKFVMISVPLFVQRLINLGTRLIYETPEVLIKMC